MKGLNIRSFYRPNFKSICISYTISRSIIRNNELYNGPFYDARIHKKHYFSSKNMKTQLTEFEKLVNEYKLYISQNPRNSTSIRYTRYIKKLLVSIEHYKKTIEKIEKKNKYNFFVATFKIYINYCLRILQKRDIDMYNKCLSMLHKINAVISLTFLNNKNIGTCAEILYFQLRHIMSINV